MSESARPNTLEVCRIEPPDPGKRARRTCREPAEGKKRDRYCLPRGLESGSPVGYRRRISLREDEIKVALGLLSLTPPTDFEASEPPTEAELFEECALGVLSARQSTNFRGQRQVTLGPGDMPALDGILREMSGLEQPVLDGATHAHVVLARPYRTPFTMLLTFVGHQRLRSLLSVPRRALDKRLRFRPDIPTIGYLTQLHLGILADGMERAAVVASEGRRRAQIFMRPFCAPHRRQHRRTLRQLERLVGLTPAQRRAGWQVELVARVGGAAASDRISAPRETWRRLGANLLAFRSERIQPGIN